MTEAIKAKVRKAKGKRRFGVIIGRKEEGFFWVIKNFEDCGDSRREKFIL